MKTDNTRVFNMDCMEYMKDVPDKYFELAVVDPPYGIGADKENTSMSAGSRIDGTKRKMTTWNNPVEKKYAIKNWDKNRPNEEYWLNLFRISKNQIIWGGNYFSDTLKPHGGWIVWEKGVPEGMSLSQGELAWNSCLNSVRIVKILWAGYKKCEITDRFHPTQKPVKLYEWILMNYAKEGDKILDTHMGSQSSRIACYNLCFDFTGTELDKEYFDQGNKRFLQHISQLRMF